MKTRGIYCTWFSFSILIQFFFLLQALSSGGYTPSGQAWFFGFRFLGFNIRLPGFSKDVALLFADANSLTLKSYYFFVSLVVWLVSNVLLLIALSTIFGVSVASIVSTLFHSNAMVQHVFISSSTWDFIVLIAFEIFLISAIYERRQTIRLAEFSKIGFFIAKRSSLILLFLSTIRFSVISLLLLKFFFSSVQLSKIKQKVIKNLLLAVSCLVFLGAVMSLSGWNFKFYFLTSGYASGQAYLGEVLNWKWHTTRALDDLLVVTAKSFDLTNLRAVLNEKTEYWSILDVLKNFSFFSCSESTLCATFSSKVDLMQTFPFMLAILFGYLAIINYFSHHLSLLFFSFLSIQIAFALFSRVELCQTIALLLIEPITIGAILSILYPRISIRFRTSSYFLGQKKLP